MNFYPIITDDGSISLYNFEINDIYHSNIGAYTEALQKFVIPSGLKNFVKDNNTIKILDVCYGLGYNSIAAIEEIQTINPECKIIINAMEVDPKVIVFSCLLNNLNSLKINSTILDAISKEVKINNILDEYFDNIQNISPDLRHLKLLYGSLDKTIEFNRKLHNIYYQTISTRNTSSLKASRIDDLLTINFFVGDARFNIDKIGTTHDYIFQDPFTVSKDPTLWTVDFLKKLYSLLNIHGNLTTYSSAAPVRAGLIEAGFFVYKTDKVGNKASGTIAYKEHMITKNILDDKENGLLQTKSGIPYYDDENFSGTKESIIKNRENLQINSDRISSSKFLKDYKSKPN